MQKLIVTKSINQVFWATCQDVVMYIKKKQKNCAQPLLVCDAILYNGVLSVIEKKKRPLKPLNLDCMGAFSKQMISPDHL